MSGTASSKPKRQSQAGAGARSQYRHPLPLLQPALADPSVSALYSLSWALHLTLLALRAKVFQGVAAYRNVVDDQDAYLSERIVGHWDPATKSVWVLPEQTSSNEGLAVESKGEAKQDQTAILWARGFFGKGSLSRSEPTWFQREKNRVTGEHVPTAEDVTSARRAERKIYKQQKAKERADEREKLAGAMLDKNQSSRETDLAIDAAESTKPVDSLAPVAGEATVSSAEHLKSQSSRTTELCAPDDSAPQSKPVPSTTSRRARDHAAATARQQHALAERGQDVSNLEHTQLQREEALFLLFALGSLAVLPPSGHQAMTLSDVWQAFLLASVSAPASSAYSPNLSDIRPDNPFLLSYVAYHHYRSLGWVVRNGIKFCTDWVLYKGADGTQNPRGGAGPVGGHAEFAVVVVPTYADPSDAPSKEALNHGRDWRWLNTVNRVCSGVKKTVIITFVTIPPFSSFIHAEQTKAATYKDGMRYSTLESPSCLSLYTVKEVSIKRFIPTRMRD